MCLWITDFTQHVFLICTEAAHLRFSCLYSETAAVLVCILCTQYNHAPLSVTSFEAIHVWCMSPCAVSSNSLPFALCWNGQDLLHAHVVNTMVKQIPKQESAQKTDPRKKQFSCQESNQWPFGNKSSTQLLSYSCLPTMSNKKIFVRLRNISIFSLKYPPERERDRELYIII